jgi:hypothetical protein
VLVERVVSGLDPASPPDLEEWRAGFEGLARTVADARDPRGEVELRYYPRATPLLEPGTPRPVVDRGGGFYYASDWCASGLPPTLEAAAWAGRVAGEAAAGR